MCKVGVEALNANNEWYVVHIGKFNGRRRIKWTHSTGLRLDYILRLCAPTSASRAISAVAELLVSFGGKLMCLLSTVICAQCICSSDWSWCCCWWRTSTTSQNWILVATSRSAATTLAVKRTSDSVCSHRQTATGNRRAMRLPTRPHQPPRPSKTQAPAVARGRRNRRIRNDLQTTRCNRNYNIRAQVKFCLNI